MINTQTILLLMKIRILLMKYPTIDTVDPALNTKGLKTAQLFDMIIKLY